MSDERTLIFNGPDVPPTWRTRLRLAWRRLRWWTHWGRHTTEWVYAVSPPVSNIDDVVREIIGRPGWDGPGHHIIVEEDKPEGEPFGWMALPVTVPKDAVITDAHIDFTPGRAPHGRLRIRREKP